MVYKNEGILFAVSMVISILAWSVLVIGTLGIALLYLPVVFLFYLVVQSSLISHLKGNAVRITNEQFPDIYQRLERCCQQLGLTNVPDAYLLHGDGILNAFATRFLGRNFVVLYSDVVDALEDRPEAINFYIGHELGHIIRKHLQWGPVLAPAGMLPLIGAAYARAREYTCDMFGRACCASPEDAEFALAALASGHRRWKVLNIDAFLAQAHATGGFWMSFHELTSDYPWLVKRIGHVRKLNYTPPRRHWLAWLVALFVPRGGGLIVIFVVVAMVVAIAIPQFHNYRAKAHVSLGLDKAEKIGKSLEAYYVEHHDIPTNLQSLGISGLRNDTRDILYDPRNGTLTVVFKISPLNGKTLIYTPRLNKQGKIFWICKSENIAPRYLPARCR
ncbi:peptidase M48 family protein [Candidatus Parcubacteria bacterium]|nr:MAG: peptidase M48 family protein [Candidatus Parcubacteria bacterium]